MPGILSPFGSRSRSASFVTRERRYHGIGNDFILLDNRASDTPLVTPEQAVELCKPKFGVGADGVIFALRGKEGCDWTMRIFNSDGTEPEMCGNGIRCMAQFVASLEAKTGMTFSTTIHTLAGTIIPTVQADGLIRVDMGTPILCEIFLPQQGICGVAICACICEGAPIVHASTARPCRPLKTASC
jgi:diaminopimelate epimerase